MTRISNVSEVAIFSILHLQVDPNNAPHVGGNTWAGGTGGRDTAGLGGKGGPYRLDAGHNVFQLSDEEKMAVPEEVRENVLLIYTSSATILMPVSKPFHFPLHF